MCGIAGIIDLSSRPIDTECVAAMCQAMAHRGPDAGAVKAMPHAVLGHRRLAILDLSPKGNQPMTTADGRLTVVHNGEIYNYRELRAQLEQAGHQFRSTTDTEALLYGYTAWGHELSRQCRGMWAFALWDAGTERLYISRDRFGEKPLYYTVNGTRLAFASTLAGLRPAWPGSEIDPAAVASLLAYEYIPHDECIIRGIKKLAPAHYLVFSREGITVQRYWDVDYRSKIAIGLDEAVDEVDRQVSVAVSDQLVADVPVGVFLSGGVDSGYIAALAARHSAGIAAITMTVPDAPARDESANARAIATRHSLRQIEVPLGPDCIRELPNLLSTIEPFGDSSIIPTAAVSREAAKHVKVVLTGDGGDEGFGGYGVPEMAWQAERMSAGKRVLARMGGGILRELSTRRLTMGARLLRLQSSQAALLAGAGMDAFLEAREMTPPQVRRLLYGPALDAMLARPLGQHLKDTMRDSLVNHWWEGMLAVGIKSRLVDDFLNKVDTATMYHSLESRSPLLDHRLHEFIGRMPYNVLMPDAHYKGLLKRVAAKYNPREVVYSRKKGFSIPVEKYFKGGWGVLLLELVRDGVAAQLGLINPHGVRRYLQKHGLRSSYRLDRQLFTILALEIWLRVMYTRTADPAELGERLVHAATRDGHFEA